MINRKDILLKRFQRLDQPVTSLKGIGPSKSALLQKKGIRTIPDLLFFTPVRYEDRTRITPIGRTSDGAQSMVAGRVISGGEQQFPRSRKRIFKILLEDEHKSIIELIWFRYRKSHLNAFLSQESRLTAYGRVDGKGGRRRMIHPEIRRIAKGGDWKEGLGVYPVYSAIRGMTPPAVRKTVGSALQQFLPSMFDPIPEEIRRSNGLPELGEAIKNVHLPGPTSSMDRLNEFDTPFHKRMLFDRFFLVMLVVALLKNRRKKRVAPKWPAAPSLQEELKKSLPFQLTADQTRALSDILHDLSSGRPMNRLLLGDVGCGKTVVAALAAHLSIRNGYQAVLMAPTQVLALQHMEYFRGLDPSLGFRPVLITGRLKPAERTAACKEVAEGKHNLVIGTQALVQEALFFRKLGIVIIDEQQRFGVRVRAMLEQKEIHAHQLVMSATPIPRTLAIAAYGDMDLSIIREFPRERPPVLTYLVGKERKRDVFVRMKNRLEQGEQAMVICPAIEGEEEGDSKDAVRMAGSLKRLLSPSYEVGLIHGRLQAEEKLQVMEQFRKGILHVLVGTTILEVGVHVPKATVMIVEHPERFGLSQLHQLRGRVGRGNKPGLCLLMVPEGLSEKQLLRLKVLVNSMDGFEIALKDLEQRGHGEFTGTMQAGIGELEFSEMLRESDLLFKAKSAAEKLIDRDPELAEPDHRPLKTFVDGMLTTPVDL
ncbi:MAG: ATP-dependent DNA helicase RecG [Desulfobacteraceae bacterium]|nr:MAG: ATP-dependent DNA helicase RecG [Desulfobacteraceae bacterium]